MSPNGTEACARNLFDFVYIDKEPIEKIIVV